MLVFDHPTLFRDVLKVRISRGQLAKTIAKVTESMKSAYAELVAALPLQPYVRSDETGHKENGKRFWTWCFRGDLFTQCPNRALESPAMSPDSRSHRQGHKRRF